MLRRGEVAGGEARKIGSDTDFLVAEEGAGVAQLVERLLPKQDAEGSSPFTRFLESSTGQYSQIILTFWL
jgi:hypothetical protein